MMALLLNANDSVSRSYSITKPSPLHPIVPSECGERTENLFDGKLLEGMWSSVEMNHRNIPGNVYRSMKLTLSPGIYTLVFSKNVYLVRKIVNDVYSEPNTNLSDMTFTVETLSDVGFSFRMPSNIQTPWDDNVLISINKGSTALPFEPYGYKIPISSANTTTPIYLGEVPTTRKIGKLVLTGNEAWHVNVEGDNQIYNLRDTIIPNQSPIICNVFESTTWGSMRTKDESISVLWTFAPRTINIRYDAVNLETLQDSLSNFKTYLQQQYANGTPVTVWYVLAEPETGSFNEPLRKIGDYADTIDSTQTTAQIPTTANSTTISWGGQGLAPSEVELTYRKPKGQ